MNGHKAKSLTAKQAMFIQEYLIDLNATQAAIRAGYSKKTARQMGDENLSKPVIATAIQTAIDKRANKLELTAEAVLQDIIRIGDDAEKDKKYSDALKSRELLGKHLKLFTDKVETTTDAPPDLTINFVKVEREKP
jgi:phage terminase small subunit